jgi:hypothetical protein
MGEIKSKLRNLRLIQFLLIGLVLISASFAEFLLSTTNSRWNRQRWLMTGLAVVCVLEGFHLRRRILRPSAEALARNTDDPAALRRWHAWQLMCLAMAATVAMYGLVVRMVFGGSLWQALLFYSVSLSLLLLWTPRMPAAVAST